MTILSKHWYAVYLQGLAQSQLKNKNLLPYRGIPLVRHSIELAKKIEQISNVFVTTDSEDIINIANSLGAVAVRRPKYASGDDSRDSEYLYHLEYLSTLNLPKPDAFLPFKTDLSRKRCSEHFRSYVFL